MGIIFTMPLPQMLAATMTAMDRMASHQLVEALLMALGARDRPMRMMMGPVTTGGRKRITLWTPTALISPARTR